MRLPPFGVGSILLVGSVFACGRSLLGTPCPCVDGYTCCAADHACYPVGQCPGEQATGGDTSAGGTHAGGAGSASGNGANVETSTEDAFVFPEFCTTDGWCGALVDYSDVWGSGPDDIWLAAARITDNGTRSALLHFDGREFSNYELEPVFSGVGVGEMATLFDIETFWGSGKDDLWAVGANGLLHWDGTSWSVPLDAACHCQVARGEAIWGAAPNDIWIAGGSSFSHYDGSTWTTLTGPTMAQPKALWGSASDDIWAVGWNGSMAHYDGESWTAFVDAFLGTPTTSTLEAVWGSAPDDVWAAGVNSTLLHWDGVGWENRSSALPDTPPGATRDLVDIWGDGADNVWIAATDGSLLHFDGDGWFKAPEQSKKALRAVWGDKSGGIVGVGLSGSVLRYGGDAWRTNPPRVVSSDLMTLWGAPGQGLLALGGGQSAVWDGTGWQATNAGPYAIEGSRLAGTSSKDVWAVNVSGSSLLDHFNGATWTPVYTVTSPGSPVIYSPLSDVWTSAANDIWAVGPAPTEGNGVLVHSDGAAWTLFDSGVPVNLTSVWGSARDDVWATTSSEAVLHFDGATWTPSTLSAMSTSPSTTTWQLVRGTAKDDVWLFGGFSWSGYKAGGFTPGFRHFDGTTWSPPVSFGGGSAVVNAMWSPGPGQVWVLLSGVLLRFDPEQGLFVTEHVGPVGGDEPVGLHGIWGTDTQVFAVGSRGAILHKTYRAP
jgi:hypothetical protein